LDALRDQADTPGAFRLSEKDGGTDDLWEARVIFSGNIFRLLGWMEGTDKLVLEHGFTKKTDKTPLQEIQITETRKKIYENNET
jgi:phage-related protein